MTNITGINHSSHVNAMTKTPFPGPRPFTDKEHKFFFGRVDETRELATMVRSNRIVLLYARSGAGKTSLINAGLIPTLQGRKRLIVPSIKEGDYEVLPIARVSGALPNGVKSETIKNIYSYMVLLHLVGGTGKAEEKEDRNDEHPHDQMIEKGIRIIDEIKLVQYFKKIRPTLNKYKEMCPRVLVIDQFEEIITRNIEHWEKRGDFFLQLREAILDDPLLRVALVVREDYLPDIEYYADFVPGGFRSRYRLEKLGEQAALDAIKCPVGKTNRRFDSGVAEELVEMLLQSHHQSKDGRRQSFKGQYVEPVVLQLVCERFWEVLRDNEVIITKKHVRIAGDVDRILQQHYEAILLSVRKEAGEEKYQEISQSLLKDGFDIDMDPVRVWIEKCLITSVGTRGFVHQDQAKGTTEGMPNDAVEILTNAHLIHRDVHYGAPWYELLHDAFIGPILAANREARENLKNLARKAERGLYKNPRDSTENAQKILEVTYSSQARDLLQRCVSALRWRQDTQFIKGHSEPVNAVIFIKGGREIASVSSDGTVRFWDTESCREVKVEIEGFPGVGQREPGNTFIPFNNRQVSGIAISYTGERLAIASGEGEVALWKIERVNSVGSDTGQSPIFRITADIKLRCQDKPHCHDGRVNVVTFSTDGELIATASDDGTAKVWDAKTGKLKRSFTEHWSKVNWASFSQEGKYLATASSDQTVRIWNLDSCNAYFSLLRHTNVVNGVDFHPDKNIVVTGSWDGTVKVWQLENTEEFAIRVRTGGVHRVAFSPDGQHIAAICFDGTARIWDAKAGRENDKFSGHEGVATALAFSSDSKILATGGWDTTVRIWKVSNPGDATTCVVLSADGTHLATAHENGAIYVQDIEYGKKLTVAQSENNEVILTLAFDRCGHRLVGTKEKNGKILVWDVASGQLLRRNGPLKTNVTRAILSPDGQLIAFFDKNMTVTLWDVRSEKPLPDFDHKKSSIKGWINGITFNADGTRLATFGLGGKVEIWNVKTGEQIRKKRIDINLGFISSLTFSNDGQWIAIASTNGTVILFNLASNKPYTIQTNQKGGINAVAFSPDGTRLVTVSNDGYAKVWNITDNNTKELFNFTGQTAGLDAVAFNSAGRRIVVADRNGLSEWFDLDIAGLIKTSKDLIFHTKV